MTSNLRYKDVNNMVDELKVGLKKKILASIFSIGFALLLVSGPIALCINFMIFMDYTHLLLLIICLLLILFIYIADSTYLKLITKGKVEGIKLIYMTDTFIMGLALLGLLAIIFEIGVI